MGLLSGVIWLLTRIVLSLLFYGTPLLALWLASSLAAYLAGPPYLPFMVGALMFPIIPGLWELYSWMHRNRDKKPWFTPLDRISMRTFVVGLVFLAGMLSAYPKTSFVALSTRGDWMLDGVNDARAEQTRQILFAAAGGVEWLYKAVKKNPYRSQIDEKAKQRTEQASKQLAQDMAKKREEKLAQNTSDKAAEQQEKKSDDQQGEQKTDSQDAKTSEKQSESKADQTVKKIEEGKTEEEKAVDSQGEKKAKQQDGNSEEQHGEQKIEQQQSKLAKKQTGEKGEQSEKKDNSLDGKIAKQDDGSKVDLPKKEKADAKREAKKADKSAEKQTYKTAKSKNDSTAKQERKASPQAKLVRAWPWKNARLHPIIAKMPKSAQTSIESVANYIAEHEQDPVFRIKALHDWVVDHIAYDADAYYTHNIHDQDAQSVFEKRKGVCAGYANLLSALATAINEQIIVVIGDVRDPDGDKMMPGGHAWNAAHVGDNWYLIDSCWDAGSISREKGFKKNYKLDYFMPPPETMIQDHFPDDSNWQLLANPLSQGDFLRQPMLRPSFLAANLKLITPKKPRVEASSEAMIILKNPTNQWLVAGLEQNGRNVGYGTKPTNDEIAQLVCPMPKKGTYRMNMFVCDQPDNNGKYDYVGSIDFVNR